MPAWLLELIGTSPTLAGIAIVAWCLYLTTKHAMNHPVALAMLIGVILSEKRREYLLKLAKISRGEGDEPVDQPGDPPAEQTQISPEAPERRCRCRETPERQPSRRAAIKP